jgi:DNA-binding transcriptional LysR family regulator
LLHRFWFDVHFDRIIFATTFGQIGISTESINFNSTIQVNDFPTKREALMRGLGFGWLPEYIITRELENGSLRVIHTELENRARLHPRLYHRKPELLGRAVSRLIHAFREK